MLRWVVAPLVGGLLSSGCFLSHPGDGTPHDSGTRPDVPITPLFDGDFPGFDAGPPGFDADFPGFDADFPDLDAGPPRFDAGFDAGRPRRDAGPRPDAGPRDAGRRDAGRPDAGPEPDAGGPGRPALRFSATTFFEVEDSPVFDATDDVAFELWVRSRETGDATFCQKGDAVARHLFVGVRGGLVVMGWEVAPLSHALVGPPLVPDRWTHLAFVARIQPDGLHSTELFVDGNLEARAAGVPNLRRALGDQVFTCGRSDVDVDEIRVWRVARDQMAIIANMNARISGSIPGMIAYWRLDERGQIALDYTAGGNVAILGRLTTADPEDPTWIRDGPF